MAFNDEWAKVYNKSIQVMTKAKRGLIPELDAVWKGPMGMVKSLDTIDKNDPQVFLRPADAKLKEKAAEVIEKEYKTLVKEKSKYAKAVDDAIKKTDKDLHKEVYRELKVLRAHLDWVENAVKNHVVLYSKAGKKEADMADAAIKKKESDMRKKGAGDEEVKEGTQMAKFAKLLVAFPTAAKTGAARAVKAIQEVKADPTPKTYNTEIDHGGRNYTQQMNNVIKLVQHKDCPEDLAKLMSGLIPYDALLKEYGGGTKRSVPLDADKQTILDLIKDYSKLVKDTMGYIEDVNKYLAKNKKKLGLK